MKKSKAESFIVMGQHAAGPGFDYKRHIYSDGRVIEKSKGKVPKRIRSMLDTGIQGETDSGEKTTPKDYARALKKVIKQLKPKKR